MNPDQPSREQIEARLTALLLGELPAAEAELLRWTISRDPELQKLHDQLKTTVGFVREAMKNPTGAPLDKETPLKLPQERRQTLLAHFKTPRPEPVQNPFWLKRINIPYLNSRLVAAAIVILIIAGLAAMLLPVTKRELSSVASMDETFSLDATKHAERDNSVSQQNAAINNMRQINASVNEWESETGKARHAAPGVAGAEQLARRNPGQPAVQQPQVQIALPNTESSQTSSDEFAGVYSDNTVGYINVSSGAASSKENTSYGSEKEIMAANTSIGDSPFQNRLQNTLERATNGTSWGAQYFNFPNGGVSSQSALTTRESQNAKNIGQTSESVQAGTTTSGVALPSLSTQPQPEVETWSRLSSSAAPSAAAPSAPGNPDVGSIASAPPVPAGGTYNLAAAGKLPQVAESQSAAPILGELPTLGALPASKAENPSAPLALMPPRLRQQYGERNGMVNEVQLPRESQRESQGIVPITEAPSAASASVPAEVQAAPTVTAPNGNNSFVANAASATTWQSQLEAKSPADTESVTNGTFALLAPPATTSQPLQARGEAGSVSGSIPKNDFNARFQFDIPANSITNAVAMDTISFGGAAGAQSGLATRGESNTKKDLDNEERMVAVTASIPAPSKVTTNMALFLPPQLQDLILDGDRNIGVQQSVKQADIPLTLPKPTAPTPQPEVQTRDNAFSTFSMNVSDVSFKLAMASLQKGRLPDPASIRSEEFINAFDYRDPEPLQGEPLGFVYERARDPFAQERDFLRFSVKAAAAGRQQGRALNLVLLLDTSGSMERADRVAIIREALRVLSAQLQPDDVVSVVTFARTARLWADGIPGNQAGATLDKVGGITPEGGTNLEEAMRLAYETALRHFIANGMNRVVLLTDGAANLGNVDPQALTQKVETERRQGIALDCFGIGWDDYNDNLLEQLSSNGDGRYAFINSPDEVATDFASKLAGALQVAAEDVKVQVEFNPNRVTAWRQIGYAKHQLTKQQFRDNTVAAGAIAAREAGNALYVIETKPDGEGPVATVRVRYRIPGTQDNRERSWLVEYDGAAPELAQSAPPMRLAASAAEISEWMAGSPFAQDVTPDELLNYLSGVPEFYGTDERPKQLEWMIREAKSVSGK